jgi:hypothetical protein
MCFLIHFMIYFLAIFNFLYLFFFNSSNPACVLPIAVLNRPKRWPISFLNAASPALNNGSSTILNRLNVNRFLPLTIEQVDPALVFKG